MTAELVSGNTYDKEVIRTVLQQQDLLCHILSFLPWIHVRDSCRNVSTFWHETSKLVPFRDLIVQLLWMPVGSPEAGRSVAEQFPNIQALYFPRSFVPRRPFAEIIEKALMFPNLREFYRLSQRYAPGDMEYLRMLPSSLEVLELAPCKTPWGLSDLASFRQLRILYISDHSFFKACLQELAQAFPCLEQLSARNTQVEGKLEDMAHLHFLQVLDLEGTANVTGDYRSIFQPSPSHQHPFPRLTYLGLGSGMFHSSTGRCFYEAKEDSMRVVNEFYRYFSGNQEGQSDMVVEDYRGRRQPRTKGLRLAGTFILPRDSPYYYSTRHGASPPFTFRILWCGQSCGWRWEGVISEGETVAPCQITWMEGVPPKAEYEEVSYVGRTSASEYGRQRKDLESEVSNSFYKYYTEPPSEDDYAELCRRRFRRW